VPTPSEGSATGAGGLLDEFLSICRRWSGDRSPTPEAHLVGEELSQALDRALSAACPGDEVTIVAVGGYGRRELCLHSDVDLLLLHDGSAGPETARAILYPLWDRGLRVGHSLRTIREAQAQARDDLTVLCSLLTPRVVAGPPERGEQLEAMLARLLRSERGGLDNLLAEEEWAVWEAEPFLVQAPDLKHGRGGLRSLHRLVWDGARRRLLGDGEPPALPLGRGLTSVRTALHAIGRRATDRYEVELRGLAGAWLGRDAMEVAAMVNTERLEVDSLAGRRWGRAHRLGEDPVAAAGRTVARFVRDRWGRGPGGPAATPLALALRAGRESRGRLSEWETERVTETPPAAWTEADRAALVALLATGRAGWEGIGSLWAAGWVDSALPELSHLRGLPQAVPFHDHPVDAHLGRTVSELLAVADGAVGWCEEVADQVGALDEALLAAFLHDVGKGRPGDHSLTGAAIATRLLARLGFSGPAVGLIASTVRNHLLLGEAAFRRDISDPRVITSLARSIVDLHSLRVLALVSVADARATGAATSTAWRGDLLRRLYQRLEVELQPTGSEWAAGEEKRLLALAGPAISSQVVEAHLSSMPAEYLLRFGAETAAAHLQLAQPPPADHEIRLAVVPGVPVATVNTVAGDRPGLLATITGVLALHNLAVLEARVATRADGLAMDTFRVIDALGSDMIGQARWPAVREDMTAALTGRLDLASRLARKREGYPTRPGPHEVRIDRAGGDTIIEIRGPDRIGLLHDITCTLARLGLDVRLAKIDTRGDQVVDVFTVEDREPASDQRRRAIGDALAALGGGGG
jgi:[protein-PII] uridylyltransferase